MAYMFSGCYTIQKVDLSSFDISNVNNNLYPYAIRDIYKMHGFMSMFNYCTSLQEVTFEIIQKMIQTNQICTISVLLL